MGTCIAVICIGVLYEALKVTRTILERRWAARIGNRGVEYIKPDDGGHHNHHHHQSTNEDEGAHLHGNHEEAAGWKFSYVPFVWWIDLPRAGLVFLEIGLGLVLMLIAMTFNVGLFIMVCCGGMIGSLLFGRFSAGATKSLCH